jgi:hypothetical protein
MPLNKPRRAPETICEDLARQFLELAAALRLERRPPSPRRVKPITAPAALRALHDRGIVVSRATLYRWIRSGILPTVRVGGQLWVLPARLNQIAAELETP